MTKLEIRDMGTTYGAEVHGLDPAAALDESTLADLRRAFDERSLLVFRDVELSYPQQQALVDQLLGAPDSLAAEGARLTGNILSNRDPRATSGTGLLQFHTDAMWSAEPFELVSLYAVEAEPGAPPTTFANMERAWVTLPEPLRRRVEDLHVVQGEGQRPRAGQSEEELASNLGRGGHTRVTPIAWRHPRTGRTLLYVSEQQTREVVELPGASGQELLEELFAHLYEPANVVVHEWHDRDLAAWDNLAVQHARPNVLADGPTRTLRRAIVPPTWLWGGASDAGVRGVR